MATEAEDEGERLLVEVAFEIGADRRIDREVRIEVGEHSVPSTTTILPVRRTQLSMSARYRPPLG
jgi:hypothetical protein